MRLTHTIDIVGEKATAVGTEKVRGEIRIDVGDAQTAQHIKALYRQTDLAVYELLSGEKWRGEVNP